MTRILYVDDISNGWRVLLEALVQDGDRVAPREQRTFELTDVTIIHANPEDCLLVGVGRKLSTQLAALEALQLVGGFSDPKLTVQVAPHYENFLNGDSFHGAYGLRTRDKVGLVIDRLQRDPGTRQACMQFWSDPYDLAMEGMRDYPCTMHANFRIRNSRLHMTVVMRSNDAWLGYPYDVVQFSTLHRAMASFLGVLVGDYVHTVHSMHLYERNLEAAAAILATPLSTDDRPLLRGGIVTATSAHLWSAVQLRAKMITYSPHEVTARNDEEAWLIEQAKKWCGVSVAP